MTNSTGNTSPETPPPAPLLHALLGKLGVSVGRGPLEQARGRAAKNPDGSLARQIHAILTEARVMNVTPAQLPWRRFDQRRLPALVFHEDNWFLAERVSRERIGLTDADGGARVLTDADLQDAPVLWLRVILRPVEERKPLFGGDNIAASLIWRELFREKAWLVNVLVATLMVNTLAISTSIFAMQVYDRVVPTLAYATLTTLVAGMALIFSLDWFLKTIRARILDSMSTTVDKRVSQQVYEHLLHLRLDVQPRSLGTLAAQVSGLDSVRQFFSSGVIFGLVDMPFALLFIAFIALIGGPVSWVYILLLPVAITLGFITQRRLRGLLREQLIRINERQGLLVDSIRGAESIRANNAGWRFSEDWRAISTSISGYSVQHKAISNLSTVTTGTLSSVAYVSAVVVGVGRIEAGDLTMGGLIACSILGGRVIAPIAQGVQHLAQWQNVSQSLRMVNQVLAVARERSPDKTLLLPDNPPDRLMVRQLRFVYPESPVRQLDIPQLDFKAGDRVLLAGPVGCGKSTLLKVLAGLYRPAEGRVIFGDADLWEIDPQVIAAHLGYLPQSVHLFKGTLRANLALSGAVGDSRLLQVAKALGIDAIAADSPQGMDLAISEGGDGLSGGQRQLVALARLITASPRIWLLDEPTASLDNETEARVWQVLKEEIGDEDILVCATHRPMQAIELVNRVIVMRQGEIVRDGKPEAVLPSLMGRVGGPAGAPRTPPRPAAKGSPGNALDMI
uniref:ATP-binding cassette, subfamily C, LapB n=1 Tax=Candidatus Kentrum sp. DK TaxID=2126562 RepID=A0A450T804_9GAMM|nr:MAG: ATP-binding cassette, subfamily C, LapB [Candidatus Kentron sp. DK]